MTKDLRPYLEYRDSGVPWVDRIPVHWSEKRAKYYFKEIDERSQMDGGEMLSVSHITGVTPRSQKNVTMFKAESNVGQKLCQPGDLVINTMWAWMAALGVSNYAGIVSPAYGVYRSRNSKDYDHYYLDHLLRAEGYRSEYICRSTGIRSSRLRLYPDKFLSMRVLCPPIDEQKAISKFLKAQDRPFWRFIRNKRRLIELLVERRTVLTYEAINSSEAKWLRFGVVAGRLERLVHRESDQIYTPVGLFNRGRGIFHKEPTQGKELGDSIFYWIKPGDLVFSGQFAWEGAVAIAQPIDGDCIASHRYPIFKCKPDLVEVAYLYSFFTTGDGDMLLNAHSRGAAGRNRPLNPRTLMKEKIPIPPLHMQKRISEVFELEQKARNEIVSQISFLQEYRTQLISDVVTGKVDVRGIEVPEVTDEEPLTLDEDIADTGDMIEDNAEMEIEE